MRTETKLKRKLKVLEKKHGLTGEGVKIAMARRKPSSFPQKGITSRYNPRTKALEIFYCCSRHVDELKVEHEVLHYKYHFKYDYSVLKPVSVYMTDTHFAQQVKLIGTWIQSLVLDTDLYVRSGDLRVLRQSFDGIRNGCDYSVYRHLADYFAMTQAVFILNFAELKEAEELLAKIAEKYPDAVSLARQVAEKVTARRYSVEEYKEAVEWILELIQEDCLEWMNCDDCPKKACLLADFSTPHLNYSGSTYSLVNLKQVLKNSTIGSTLLKATEKLPFVKRKSWRNPVFKKFSEVVVYPTTACNYSCAYCFEGNGEKPIIEVMTRETADKVIDFFVDPRRSEKILTFWFFGGEAMLEWELIKYFVKRAKEIATQRGMVAKFGITTNGSLIDAEKVEYMVKENFGLIISYDGKYSQSKHRGPRDCRSCSQKRVETSIRNVASTPFSSRMTIAMQVVPGDISRLYENVMSAFQLGARNVALNKIIDSYKPYSAEDFKELEKQFARLAEFVRKEHENGGHRRVQFFEKRLNHLLGGANDSVKSVLCNSYTCGACKKSISVSPSGDIYPCQRLHFKDFKVGSVFEGLDAEKRRAFLGREFKSCRGCEVEPCSPCFAANYLRNGDIMKTVRGGCEYERRLFQAVKKLITDSEKVLESKDGISLIDKLGRRFIRVKLRGGSEKAWVLVSHIEQNLNGLPLKKSDLKVKEVGEEKVEAVIEYLVTKHDADVHELFKKFADIAYEAFKIAASFSPTKRRFLRKLFGAGVITTAALTGLDPVRAAQGVTSFTETRKVAPGIWSRVRVPEVSYWISLFRGIYIEEYKRRVACRLSQGETLYQAANNAADSIQNDLNMLTASREVEWVIKALAVRSEAGMDYVLIDPVAIDKTYMKTPYPHGDRDTAAVDPMDPQGRPGALAGKCVYWRQEFQGGQCNYARHAYGETGREFPIDYEGCGSGCGDFENCETGCLTGCEQACEGTPCQATCQSGCEVDCMTSCELADVCQTGCEVSCQSGCEVGCESGCQIGCECGSTETCPDSCTLSAYPLNNQCSSNTIRVTGTVVKDGVGVRAELRIYVNNNYETKFYSNSDGTYSQDIAYALIDGQTYNVEVRAYDESTGQQFTTCTDSFTCSSCGYSLTCSVSPASLCSGETFTVSASLSSATCPRNGKILEVLVNNTKIGEMTTDANGNASKAFTATDPPFNNCSNNTVKVRMQEDNSVACTKTIGAPSTSAGITFSWECWNLGESGIVAVLDITVDGNLILNDYSWASGTQGQGNCSLNSGPEAYFDPSTGTLTSKGRDELERKLYDIGYRDPCITDILDKISNFHASNFNSWLSDFCTNYCNASIFSSSRSTSVSVCRCCTP